MGSIGEKHLSRLASPKKWDVRKKGIKYIARPSAGPHKMAEGVHLITVFRDMLKYAKTVKEVRSILLNQEIYVDGKRRKNEKFMVGLMDVLFIPKTKETYRMVLSKKGKFKLIPIDEKESNLKVCKINGKTALKKKTQLNLYDGKNILADKGEHKVGGSVLVEVPSLKIKDSFPLEKGSYVYLSGGKHIGSAGVIEEIKEKTIIIKKDKELIKTSKNHAFVIGKQKPSIQIEQK